MSVDVLDTINNKLTMYGITWTDNQVIPLLDEIDTFIKNYCNIENIPTELVYVRANMVVDYVRNLTACAPPESGTDLDTTCTQKVGPLTLVSSGDVTYQFGSVQASKNNVSNAHIVDLDKLLLNYTNQLNSFRRLKW